MKFLSAVRSLKNNKSPGVDNIVNEQIKATISYVKLFNIVLTLESYRKIGHWVTSNLFTKIKVIQKMQKTTGQLQ